MKSADKFPSEVHDQLKYYVYRLIDPRSGQTFYVGKGKGDRVFAHAKNLVKSNGDDELDEKSQIIQEIINSDLEVLHVIHRHGIEDELTAFEIEAALIEAYPGLKNKADGHDNTERGCAHADELIKKYKMEAINPKHSLVAISIGRSLDENKSVYDAVRMFWRINLKRIEKIEYVLAHRSGIVLDVFKVHKWLPYHDPEFSEYVSRSVSYDPPRYGFIGRPAPEEIRQLYKNTRLPAVKKGAASPIRYFKPGNPTDEYV